MIHYISPTGIASAWIGNEINIVMRHGVPVVLHSLHPSRQAFFASEWARKLDADTRVIYPIPKGRLLASVLAAPFLFRGRFFSALMNAKFGKRESFRNRVVGLWHFLVACDWARRLRHENVSLIHSQWIHSGGTVGMYGAWLLGVPFSFTGHAADLFRERCALEDKVRRAEFIVCISEFHKDLFRKLGAREEQLQIVYCGIDITHFSPRRRERRPGQRQRILTAGRLVEKKGFEYVVDACRILVDRGMDIECEIRGDGPLEDSLRERIAKAGLDDRVTLTARPLKQEEIPDFMHTGDVFCLACCWAKDDDVDGLPQMLMEAMACGLPSVSTKLVGIPDLVIDGEGGLLVEPRSAEQLADALQKLLTDEQLAARLAEGGRRHILQRFEINDALQPLISRFRGYLAAGGSRGLREPITESGDASAAPGTGPGALPTGASA